MNAKHKPYLIGAGVAAVAVAAYVLLRKRVAQTQDVNQAAGPRLPALPSLPSLPPLPAVSGAVPNMPAMPKMPSMPWMSGGTLM